MAKPPTHVDEEPKYLGIFDKVLSGETEKDSASGNACFFEVGKENTIVEFRRFGEKSLYLLQKYVFFSFEFVG